MKFHFLFDRELLIIGGVSVKDQVDTLTQGVSKVMAS